jgi:hypothetical protein
MSSPPVPPICGDSSLQSRVVGASSFRLVASLGFNQIGDEGAIALGEALALNTTLRRLHMNGNKVGQDGAVRLAIALVDNASLEQLNVGANQIDAPGALAILEALRYGNHRSDQ